jgi:hypothetical protein
MLNASGAAVSDLNFTVLEDYRYFTYTAGMFEHFF